MTAGGRGLRPNEPYAQYDPATSSWRMLTGWSDDPRLSDGSWVAFTASGSMQSGRLFLRPTMERRITVDGYSFWPTPTATRSGVHWARAKVGDHRQNLREFLAWQWVRSGRKPVSGLRPNPEWIEWLMGFPVRWTATANSVTQSSRRSPSTSGRSSSRRRRPKKVTTSETARGWR